MAETIYQQITHLAGELKNSTLTEGYLFEKFVEEYMANGSVKAFATLQQNGASRETCELASKLVAHASALGQVEIDKQIEDVKAGMTMQQVKFVTEFCREYSIHGDYNRAASKFQKRIDLEEPFASDEVFKESFNEISEKFKPKKVTGYQMSVEPDDGLIFNIRFREYDSNKSLKPFQAKELLAQYIFKAYKGTVKTEEIKNEVDVLYRQRKPSLALQIAFGDVSTQYSKLRKVGSELEKNRNLVSSYNIPLYTAENESQTEIMKGAPGKSASQKLNVIRSLVTRLQKGEPIKDVLKDSIKLIAEFEDLDVFSRLPKKEQAESPTLLGVLHRHTEKLSTNRSTQALTEVLLDSYEVFLPINKAKYHQECRKEILALGQGQGNSLVTLAINEFEKSRELLTKGVVLNNKVDVCIKSWRQNNPNTVKEKVFKKFQVQPDAAPPPDLFVEKEKNRGYSVHNN